METEKVYDNYLFDLYGTLIDIRTDEYDAKTWKTWLKYLNTQNIAHPRYRKCRRDFYRLEKKYIEEAKSKGDFKCPEIDYCDIYRDMFAAYGNKDLSDELILKAAYAFREASRSYMKLFPGVKEFLSALKNNGKKIYILSNAQASFTWPEIHNFGLEKMMDDIFLSSEYHCMKPDVLFYQSLLDKYEMDKEKTVMIGDSFENDYQGGIAAGIAAIHLSGENGANRFYLNRI